MVFERSRLPDLRRGIGVRSPTLFARIARDEASESSDVDIVVEFDGPTTFDRYFGAKEALEEILGTRVDLATPAMLKPRLKLEVDRESVRGVTRASTCRTSSRRASASSASPRVFQPVLKPTGCGYAEQPALHVG